MESKHRYLVLVGGSGSGKSVFASQKMILRLVSERGHRILAVRKVANTLRESVFKRIKNELLDMGLLPQFTVNITNMSFTHVPTGNEIITAGLDDVEKLKSIEKITSIWVEEATEIKEGDFDQLDLRLRGETSSYKQIILTFNPVSETNWIKKRFFDNHPPDTYALKTTFKDNAFIDEDYRRVLEQKASVSPNLYRIYYLGEWGKEDIERPWFQNFSPEKHIKETAVFNPNLPVYFSLDFNVDPFICLASHIWQDNKGMHFHVFNEIVIEKNGSVPEMCDRLMNQYGMKVMSQCYFTGDATSRKREIVTRNNVSAWSYIDTKFGLGQRLLLPRANPSVSDNRHLISAVLAFHPDLQINPQCKKLIFDMQFVEADENGDIVKKNRDNEAQRCDAGDEFRYLCNVKLANFFEQYKFAKK